MCVFHKKNHNYTLKTVIVDVKIELIIYLSNIFFEIML